MPTPTWPTGICRSLRRSTANEGIDSGKLLPETSHRQTHELAGMSIPSPLDHYIITVTVPSNLEPYRQLPHSEYRFGLIRHSDSLLVPAATTPELTSPKPPSPSLILIFQQPSRLPKPAGSDAWTAPPLPPARPAVASLLI